MLAARCAGLLGLRNQSTLTSGRREGVHTILWMTFCPQSEYVSELLAEVRSNWCATCAHNNDAQHLNFASIYFSILAVSPRGGYRADGQ